MLSVSTILLLLSFQLLVRYKPLGWLLNGRKASPSQPKCRLTPNSRQKLHNLQPFH